MQTSMTWHACMNVHIPRQPVQHTEDSVWVASRIVSQEAHQKTSSSAFAVKSAIEMTVTIGTEYPSPARSRHCAGEILESERIDTDWAAWPIASIAPRPLNKWSCSKLYMSDERAIEPHHPIDIGLRCTDCDIFAHIPLINSVVETDGCWFRAMLNITFITSNIRSEPFPGIPTSLTACFEVHGVDTDGRLCLDRIRAEWARHAL